MRIVRRRLDSWDDNIKRRLKCATLLGGYLRMYCMRAFPQSPTIVVFSQKQVMGWAFIFRNTHNDTADINLFIFINKRYRRKGLAVLLVEEALKDFRTISLAKWDDTTRRLFRRLQSKHPGRITVFDWWKGRHRYEEIAQKALLF